MVSSVGGDNDHIGEETNFFDDLMLETPDENRVSPWKIAIGVYKKNRERKLNREMKKVEEIWLFSH
ncbi:predicted protein [Arabidopsis lyrata subsp. lyrata]|uniref:Predicted protein n=1 Tax=Arabidopsis lyrata subsp. lyrata TaxID=81972 RepID=D7LG98_ARALL|nr:predicted protein [Arabidopsis lyrata subsp. lyrata]